MANEIIKEKNLTPENVIIQVEPVAVNLEQARAMMGKPSKQTFQNWIDRAGFPVTHIGGRVIVSVAAMRKWMDDNEGKTIKI